MHRNLLLMIALCGAIAAPVAAQLALPQTSLPRAPDLIAPIGSTLDTVDSAVRAKAAELLALRERTLDRLLRANRDTIERDRSGEIARRGELLVMDADDTALAPALTSGFALIARERIDGLDLAVARLAVPAGLSLAKAQAQLESLLPEAVVSADNLHRTAGGATSVTAGRVTPPALPAIATPVGVIDGGVGPHIPVDAVRGFATGAPQAGDHASAVASLLAAARVRSIRVADVYGTDPAGGNALAITRALGWLKQGGARVVTISLVGPANPVLARAIAAAQRGGVIVVAAVGNDGPAAPPAYPASYPGVIAVTAVDKRDRPLIEAGRALHLDYAAPGADLWATNVAGSRSRVRGTSFAAPLVAARAAAALEGGSNWAQRLDAEARDLGPRGADRLYGRGLLCGSCRPAR